MAKKSIFEKMGLVEKVDDDYVNSFATQNIDSYKWVLDLHNKYPKMALDAILALCYTNGRRTDLNTKARYDVRHGGMDITDKTRAIVEDNLSFIYKFYDAVMTIGGRKFMCFNAIIFCYMEKLCDNNRLLHIMTKHAANRKKFNGRTKACEYITDIENAYNCGLSTNRIYIESEWKKYQDRTKSEQYEECDNEE